jgi:hypothetical protein
MNTYNFKNIFDPSIFAYLITDGIIRNVYTYYLTSNAKLNTQYKQQIPHNLNVKKLKDQKQKKIDEIKKIQIEYYNKKFTKKWIKNYNFNQIVKKELM